LLGLQVFDDRPTLVQRFRKKYLHRCTRPDCDARAEEVPVFGPNGAADGERARQDWPVIGVTRTYARQCGSRIGSYSAPSMGRTMARKACSLSKVIFNAPDGAPRF
jgi:hypothetical protein